METVTLRGENLVLTPILRSDIDRITELCNDPVISKWTVVPSPYTRDDALFFIQNLAERGWEENSPHWAIRTEDDGPLLGVISFTSKESIGEIGFWLDSAQRGKGIMPTAVNLVADFAFRTMKLAVLRWNCAIIDDEINWASARVAWKCGFTFEGRARRALALHPGRVYDALGGSLLPEDTREPKGPWFGPTDAHPAFPQPSDPEALVRQFHDTYNLPIIENEPEANRPRVHMRLGLVAEEFAELVGATYGALAREEIEQAFSRALTLDDGTRDTVEVADAIGDLIYVLYGMALELGIPIRDVLAEIQGSNLSKLGQDGKPIYREDGKVLKGPNYYPPNIRKVLGL